MKTTTIMLDYDGINLFMFRSQSGLASAFLARVLRTAGGRLDRVLREMGEASLRSTHRVLINQVLL